MNRWYCKLHGLSLRGEKIKKMAYFKSCFFIPTVSEFGFGMTANAQRNGELV